MISLLIALILFAVGVALLVYFYRVMHKPHRPLYMKIVFDVNDQKAFNAVMGVISAYDLLDADYGESEDAAFATVGVVRDDYIPILRSLQAIPNVEVI